MKQEEKQLLIEDISARSPYGVIASVRGSDEEFHHFRILGVKGDKVWVENDILGVDDFDDVEVVKPYLRPLSSMTEEEENELTSIAVIGGYNNSVFNSFVVVDWLNKNKFDYRGLIPMGLALAAPEDMYKQ